MAACGLVVFFRILLAFVRPKWMIIMSSGIVSYVVLLIVAIVVGLKDDDRIVAQAVFARIKKWGQPSR